VSSLTTDVLIVGGGPAGSIAALVLARAGVRVTILDRATFPRDKLCGDSVNPGAMALLARHDLAAAVNQRGLPVSGMLVTGPDGVAVHARYPGGVVGRSICRRDLDALLLDAVARAGARVEQGVRVVGPVVEGAAGATRVAGVSTQTGKGSSSRPARVVIAADGRRSTLALALGLARHPRRPRRWALGAYFEGVTGFQDVGEMHVRRRHYIGVAPVPGGLANACLVVPESRARAIGSASTDALERALQHDEQLGPRFNGARRATPVTMLGPLAVDVSNAGVEGLLLAGDAAGFVDPMTGDGLRLAMRGAELAAAAALESLEGQAGAHLRLARRRREELGAKLRVNRVLRSLVAEPFGVSTAAAATRIWPGLLNKLIGYAGDVHLSSS
jgi:flavin-dependent dehydrogenase